MTISAILLSRLRPSDPHMALRIMKPAMIAVNEATAITVTSRCATCDSSCARTPSSSSWSSRFNSPVVTTMTARFCDRPVAKAFGTSLSAMPTRGFGMSASAQMRSTTAWSCGACSGVTTTARIADIAIESENHHWPKTSAALIPMTKNAFIPKEIRTLARMT